MTEKDNPAIGMYCRRCGCQHCSVSNTERLKNGSVRRRRTCRNCGYRFVTFELSIQELPSSRQNSKEGLKTKSIGTQSFNLHEQ
jgi:transcriptional regulator NrdR family protein